MALFFEGDEILTLKLEGELIETLSIDGVVVARKPIITTQPVDSTITDEEGVTLSVVADGLESTMSYQWYKSDDTVIDGAVGDSYTFNPSETGSFGFYCRVSGFGGYTQTDTAIVTVEASGSTHTLTVGKEDTILYDIWGFATGSSSVGSLSPLLTDTGDECNYLGVTEYAEGTKFAGISFVGTLKTGQVTVTIDGFGSVAGETATNTDLFGTGYGCVFDDATATNLLAFLILNEGNSLNVKIKFDPA